MIYKNLKNLDLEDLYLPIWATQYVKLDGSRKFT